MAKSSHSLHPVRLLGDSWTFLRKQPALVQVLLWFLIAPMVVLDLLDAYWPESAVESSRQIGQMGYGLAQLVMGFLGFWGFCCVLLVGRRMVINRAGRSRTSFTSVRREALRLIIPVFVTSLLRSFMTFYWSLLYILAALAFVFVYAPCHEAILSGVRPLLHALDAADMGMSQSILQHMFRECDVVFLLLPLLIPSLIYQLRTVFFAAIVASDNLRYRDALRRSRAVVRGRSWRVLWILAALTVMLFVPVQIVSVLISQIQQVAAPQLRIISAVADDVLYACSGLLFTLGLIALYGKLRKEKGRVEEVVPEME